MPTSFYNTRAQFLTRLLDVFFVVAGNTRFARECEVDGAVSELIKLIN